MRFPLKLFQRKEKDLTVLPVRDSVRIHFLLDDIKTPDESELAPENELLLRHLGFAPFLRMKGVYALDNSQIPELVVATNNGSLLVAGYRAGDNPSVAYAQRTDVDNEDNQLCKFNIGYLVADIDEDNITDRVNIREEKNIIVGGQIAPSHLGDILGFKVEPVYTLQQTLQENAQMYARCTLFGMKQDIRALYRNR